MYRHRRETQSAAAVRHSLNFGWLAGGVVFRRMSEGSGAGPKYSSKNIGQRGQDNARLSERLDRQNPSLQYGHICPLCMYTGEGGGGLTADTKMAVCGWFAGCLARGE